MIKKMYINVSNNMDVYNLLVWWLVADLVV